MVFLSIFLTSFLAAISPGPNLYFVISQTYISRRRGFISAVGVMAGVLIWLLLLSFGFRFFLKDKIYLIVLNSFSFLYLFYLGISCTFLTKKEVYAEKKEGSDIRGEAKIFLKSFALAMLNIEIPMFYGSIFTGILNKKEAIFSSLKDISFLANIFQFEVDGNYLVLFIFFSICFMLIESFVFFSSVFIFSFFGFLRKNYRFINKALGLIMIYYSLNILYGLLKIDFLKVFFSRNLLIN